MADEISPVPTIASPSTPEFLQRFGGFLLTTGRLYWVLRQVSDLPPDPAVREWAEKRGTPLTPIDGGYYEPDWLKSNREPGAAKARFAREIADWMFASEHFYHEISAATGLQADWKLQARTAIVEGRGLVYPFPGAPEEYNLLSLVQQLRRYPDVSVAAFNDVVNRLRRLAISASIANNDPSSNTTSDDTLTGRPPELPLPKAPAPGYEPITLIATDTGGIARLGGETHTFTPEQYRVVKTIEDADGAIVAGEKLKAFPDSSERPDKIIASLPPPIRGRYKTKRGYGGGYSRKS